DNQERYADAITMIEGRGPRFEGNHELEAARASYLGMLGKSEEAAAAFAALFDAGYWDNLYFEDFLYVLLALDRDEEILTRLDAAIAERPTRFNHRVRADLLRRLDRSAEAAEAMQAYRQGRPPDVEVYERLIWSLLDLERYAEAL